MSTTNALAGVAVSSLAASIEWYARLLDRSPDAQPIPTAAEWKFEGLPIASVNQSSFLNTAVINDPDGNEIVFVETLGVRHPSLD